MKVKNTGFVKFHRPGRLTFVLAILIPFFVFIFVMGKQLELLLLSLFVAPVALYIGSIVSNRRLLPHVQVHTNNHRELQSTGISWIYRQVGKGVREFDRANFSLPRTVADQSLFEQLRTIEVPEGLVEPEKVHGASPGNAVGTVIGCIICLLFIIFCLRVTQSNAPLNIRVLGWVGVPLFAFSFVMIIFSLPAFQKSRNIPAFLRLAGRGQLFRRGFVVGPGWIKFGRDMWQGDNDILLIWRTGFRGSKAEIECLLVSESARRRIRFCGVNDTDFKTLFGFWNVDDIRLEFVDSELS